MHYERAARDEAALQKTVEKIFFFKVGTGDVREGRADREGVCEMRLCNCSDIFIESPPSLSCVLQRASLTPVDVESSRGATFSIIPEAIVRAASERLTVASWDFTKTQQNTSRRGWDEGKTRGRSGLRTLAGSGVVMMKKKMHVLKIYFAQHIVSNRLCTTVQLLQHQRTWRVKRVVFQVDCTCWPSFTTAAQWLTLFFFFQPIIDCFDLLQSGTKKRLSEAITCQQRFCCAMIITLS